LDVIAANSKNTEIVQGNPLQLDVKSAILVDADTGQILYQYNVDQAFPPASMSKMMTEYLVMEALADKKIKWNDIVTASKYASDVIGSGQLIAEGEQLSVRDMLTAMAVYSANDASVALAEHVAINENAFAAKMNSTAKRLGMTSSNFINSTGLSRKDIGKNAPKDILGETKMSARDVSVLARALITKYPDILKISKIPRKKLRAQDETEMINWNWMLEENKQNKNFSRYAYQGLDGLKTGHTSEAGYCFTGTAKRNDTRLISVIMGAKSEADRFIETRKLMDYGFVKFERKQIVSKNHSYSNFSDVAIVDGVKVNQEVVTKTGLKLLVEKGHSIKNLKPTFATIDSQKRIAPIKKGTKLAIAKYQYKGQQFEVELIAKEDNEEASWIRLLFRSIINFFKGLF
jgi:D-alanyl-D-alanine carboxypeptidase (penicillin-binding protein 5/6)